jgi:serine/threonine protein kinase
MVDRHILQSISKSIFSAMTSPNTTTTNDKDKDTNEALLKQKGYSLLATGYTSKIYLFPSTSPPPRKILKLFPSNLTKHFATEIAAYETLSSNKPPATVPAYFGASPEFKTGLVLELAGKGDMYEYLYRARRMGPSLRKRDFYKWARQIVEGLGYAHERGVLHGDIYVSNFLLTSSHDGDELDAQIADWAGASINGSKSASWYRLTHQYWDRDRKDKDDQGRRIDMVITVRSEIFALGSALFHMVDGEDLWEGELEYARIERRLLEG